MDSSGSNAGDNPRPDRCTLTRTGPLAPSAQALERASHHSAEHLSAADGAALAERAAAAPGNDRLSLRATRTAWLGRRR